jgi:hypothetical protein
MRTHGYNVIKNIDNENNYNIDNKENKPYTSYSHDFAGNYNININDSNEKDDLKS